MTPQKTPRERGESSQATALPSPVVERPIAGREFSSLKKKLANFQLDLPLHGDLRESMFLLISCGELMDLIPAQFRLANFRNSRVSFLAFPRS